MQTTPYEPAANAPPAWGMTPAVRWLITINVVLQFLQLAVVSPAGVRALFGFETGDLDGSAWTIGTYMFVHTGVLHLAINMVALWLFGPRLEARWGSGQFTAYFLLCGFGGWLCHLLFVRSGTLVGASAAVIGVMLAYAIQWSSERVLVLGLAPVAMRSVVAVLIGAIIVAGATGPDAAGVAYLAHLGGLATGWAYLRMAGSMNIDRLRQRVAAVPDEPDEMPPRAFPPRSAGRARNDREAREVDDIVAQSQAAVAEATAAADAHRPTSPAHKAGMPPTAELNLLLDKISAGGIDALTPSERARLEDAAQRLKRDR